MQRHIEDQIGDGCDGKAHQDREAPSLLLDDSQEKEEEEQGDDNETQPFHEQGVEKE